MTTPHKASTEDLAFAKAFEACGSRIMLKHYSAEVLFSPQARQGFVQPDIRPIPMHSDIPVDPSQTS